MAALPGEAGSHLNYSPENIHITPNTHDVSHTGEHIPDISHFANDLERAAKAAWPRRHQIRYSRVHALLLSWEDDDLGVVSEVNALKDVLADLYHYNVQTYKIPSIKPKRALDARLEDFLRKAEEEGGQETLLIVYYGGHATRIPRSNDFPIW